MSKIINFVLSFYLLLKINAHILIFIYFLKSKFYFIIFKIFNYFKNFKNHKNSEDFFFKNKMFSVNFFLQNMISLEFFFKKNKNLNINSFLEIGSFEGSSICYFLKKLNECNVFVCVDTWEGVEELKEINFKEVEKKFDFNTKDEKKIKKMKMNSDSFFKENSMKFDMVYIDGNHHFNQVKKDLDNSFNCLNNNGFLIIDDFFWDWYDDLRSNPANAVNEFYKENKSLLKIIFINTIVIFQKKN